MCQRLPNPPLLPPHTPFPIPSLSPHSLTSPSPLYSIHIHLHSQYVLLLPLWADRRPFHHSLSWGFLPGKIHEAAWSQRLLLGFVKISNSLKRLFQVSWRERARTRWTREEEPGGPQHRGLASDCMFQSSFLTSSPHKVRCSRRGLYCNVTSGPALSCLLAGLAGSASSWSIPSSCSDIESGNDLTIYGRDGKPPNPNEMHPQRTSFIRPPKCLWSLQCHTTQGEMYQEMEV